MEVVAQELYKTFFDAERAWMRAQTQTTGSTTTTTTTTDPGQPSSSQLLEDCSLHYGEFAFLLAGLKPCLLLQLPTPAMTRAFYHDVLTSQVMQHFAYKVLSSDSATSIAAPLTTATIGHGLQCRLITKDVRSPEMPLQGYALLWCTSTVKSHPQGASIQRSIDLLCPSTTATTTTTTAAAATPALISEKDLALMLDIPGRLPSTESEISAMIEVSYWHQGDQCNEESPVLLTAFAAQPDQIPAIQSHFVSYRDSVRTLFNITLKLHIQAMADP